MNTGTRTRADAVVIGAGPNGLVAAIALADAGWDVVVLEAQPTPGGGVRSAEVTAPGFSTDLFSAFYPLAAASPVIRGLRLEEHGLEWVHAPTVLAHALDDGRAAVLHRDPALTAAGLDEFAPGDGDAWLDLVAHWRRISGAVLDALFTPMPPLRPAARLAVQLRTAGLLRLARLGVTPVRRLGEELFRGEGGRLLLGGNAAHSDVPPDAAGSGVFGWLLAMLGQDVGFPVPRTGAGALAAALTARARAAGAEVRCGVPVTGIQVTGGRAAGVRLADGTSVAVSRAVLADVPAPSLYRDLLPPASVPGRLLADLEHFQWDNSTLKVNWALDSPVPWTADGVRGAGTVHLGADSDGLVDFAADLSVGRRPRHPFVLFGQMTAADPTRSPAGTESAWAYTHLPRRLAGDAAEVADHVERIQAAVERVAPGFGETVIARHVQTPSDLQEENLSLVAGAVNGGTSALHQQLVFRPTPGLGRPETPVPGLYLASASAHPGGGVHGACGWNAARAALRASGRWGALHAGVVRAAWERVLRS
ncbi:MAG: phytoene desaturase family protein [Actinomycetes bacterium]